MIRKYVAPSTNVFVITMKRGFMNGVSNIGINKSTTVTSGLSRSDNGWDGIWKDSGDNKDFAN